MERDRVPADENDRLRRTLGLALVLLASALPAEADWSDDFDDGFSADWVLAATDDAGDPPETGFTTAAIVDAGMDDHLLLAHSTTAIRDGGGGALDFFGHVDGALTCLKKDADLHQRSESIADARGACGL